MCAVHADATDPQYDDALVEALLLASRALVGVAARSLAGIDVTLPQYRTMVLVDNHPGITVSDLAEALDVHPSTATRACDRLVAKQLLRRRQGGRDRRATELVLTARGRRLVEQVTQRRRRDVRAIVDRLPEDLRDATLTAFEAFAAAAGESRRDDPAWSDRAEALGW